MYVFDQETKEQAEVIEAQELLKRFIYTDTLPLDTSPDLEILDICEEEG